MAKPRSFLLFSWLLVYCMLTFSAHSSQKSSQKSTFTSAYPTPGQKIMNKIDSCWRSNPNWAKNRQSLADCAVGFGSGAMGGKNGAIYVVTDASDDPVNPKAGTLRYGVIQTQPLWIIFERDMTITLENELMMNSYKTIDGRGAKVEITGGPCISIDYVSHVIIHGISIHDCKPGKRGIVRSTPYHVGERLGSDGDSISIFTSSNIWIDHCYLARATDGLIDIIHGSTGITVSNSYFTQHDKVMLLGHKDGFTADKVMKVTVVFNYFGPGLIQRMPRYIFKDVMRVKVTPKTITIPTEMAEWHKINYNASFRVRYGYAHVANNRYDQWLMYAIGGSSDPTILSEGNYFVASNDAYAKQVTKRETNNGWKSWKWRSTNDVFINGAYFVPSGYGSCSPNYSGQQYFAAAHGSLVPALTSDAGPLQCFPNVKC